jgi:two-component system, response regulator, stage 0 sporulation protein F
MESTKKILYVDDEPINLFLFKKLFEKKYKVETALSGTEGLEKLQTHHDIKLVVSDMKMPFMNGLEFVAMAKERNPDLICYILTGYDITSEISAALGQRLIHHYFKKPMDEKQMMELFERHINGYTQ